MGFTAVIYCQLGIPLAINNVGRSKYVTKILIVWSNEKRPASRNRWPGLPLHVPLHIIQPGVSTNGASEQTKLSISQRFFTHKEIETEAILSLDEDTVLTTDEIDFAFVVWKQFPDRIVGYPGRSHYWDDSKSTWGYTSKWTNDYSIVLTGAAFYHRYYNYLYTEWLSPLLHKTLAMLPAGPLLRLHNGSSIKNSPSAGSWSPWNDPDHFIQRQTCLNTFAAVFGYMPLLRSNLRLDPVLLRTPFLIRERNIVELNWWAEESSRCSILHMAIIKTCIQVMNEKYRDEKLETNLENCIMNTM
ncbi:hypothetical protein NQ318_012509 [Aromia moschata]|uniref:Glycosyl transferase 64 domain-containing protein n=1 Tax=Aromia moschata TaxID=1265417 RepID=A0AAV8XCF2_9CUCU|nr:hypothetical protein NQ318_012509 [Aromia moschata]